MCTRDALTQVMQETRAGLTGIFGNKLDDVLLYGSYARGTQDNESDIDVMALVRLPQSELARYRRQVSDFSSTLDLKYDILLSIVLQDAEDFSHYSDTMPFYRNIVKEGISYA